MGKIKFNPNKEEFINKYIELKSCREMSKFYNVNLKTICSYSNKIGYKNTSKKDISWKPNSDEEFIEKYKELKNSELMAEYFNVCSKTIKKYAKKIGFRNVYRSELTDEDIKYIVGNYNTRTSPSLAKELSVSKSLITKTWRENNLKGKDNKTYYCNDRYFQNIDSYEKAYWLGFLMADGCIYNRNKGNCNKWITITLAEIDSNHLEKFKTAISSNHPIHYGINTAGNKTTNITIVSKLMAEDLAKWGCVERKTSIVQFPNFNKDFLSWGFINGYIDGDGSITISKDKNVFRYKLSVVGNFSIIKGIHDFILKFNVKGTIREDKRDYSFPFYELYFERMEYLNFIFNHTYNTKIIYLDRKYNRVKKYYNEKYKEKHISQV